MSKKGFFVLFDELGKLPPRFYKLQRFVVKHQTQQPLYKVVQYPNEKVATDAYQIYKISHQRQLMNQKLNAKEVQITSKKQKKIDKQPLEAMLKIKNSQDIQKDQKPTEKSEAKNQQSSIYSKNKSFIKSIQHLQNEKKALLEITPAMPKLMYYHEPTLITDPINSLTTYKGFFDGCTKKNPGPSGAGYFLMNHQKVIMETGWPLGTKTNNQSQFLALLYLLVDSYINGIRRIYILGDSKLIVDICNHKINTSHQNIVEYADTVKKMIKKFDQIQLEHIERRYNVHADRLANQALKKKHTKQLVKGLY